MHLNQYGNGITEISECSKFFKAPNLIDHVQFYSMHSEQLSDALPVTAASTTMAKWISGEMDAVLSSTFEIQKYSHGVPYWENGEQGFWHNEEQSRMLPSDHDPITCDMQALMLEQQQVLLQASYLQHQVWLQAIHHVHSDLEDLSFQDF